MMQRKKASTLFCVSWEQKNPERSVTSMYGMSSERYKELWERDPGGEQVFRVRNIGEILDQVGVKYRNNIATSRLITTPGIMHILKYLRLWQGMCILCHSRYKGRCISRPVEELVKEVKSLLRWASKSWSSLRRTLAIMASIFTDQKNSRLVKGTFKDWSIWMDQAFTTSILQISGRSDPLIRIIHISASILTYQSSTFQIRCSGSWKDQWEAGNWRDSEQTWETNYRML